MSVQQDTQLQELLARADWQLAVHAAGGDLWPASDQVCSTCEGNGVHPESYDSDGEPAKKYLQGVPYPVAFYVRCESCAGTGETGRWPDDLSGGAS